MINYLENGDKAIVNGYSFRKDKKTGYYLSCKPIGKRRKRLHVYLWELVYGEIPKGYEIHHKDHNKDNNNIENLELLTKREHIARHKEEMTEEQRQAKRINLIVNALPKASEWHKSAEGRNWHKQNYEKAKENLHLKKIFVCELCGKSYIAEVTGNNKFCSNACKSAYRRKSGVDNVERKCVCCGKGFITNKYSPAKYCKEHKSAFCRVGRAS